MGEAAVVLTYTESTRQCFLCRGRVVTFTLHSWSLFIKSTSVQSHYPTNFLLVYEIQPKLLVSLDAGSRRLLTVVTVLDFVHLNV